MLNTYQIQTNRAHGLYNITNQVRQAIAESNITEGLCVVFTPHTTAAITINENADPDVLHDINLGLDTTFPNKREYLHMEQNSDAHIKSSLDYHYYSPGQAYLGPLAGYLFLRV